MLELKNIRKVYKTANEEVEALKGVSIKFRESEFVSILGQSGCGKTTLLNIIGGLDRYTSGDLIINGKSTKKFKDRDWDAYRNYKIGFVFQNYNLISHQTILSNVELSLTLGGISKKERKERAIKALEEVGLKDQIHKKPNQLSGGQMQRVAIARALVNNPDIILADEPTGALDTKTSVQVMDILKRISKGKLIIMVTHNPELAEKYSSRIIRILDGRITEDSNPITETTSVSKDTSKIGRTAMSFWTAFRLSLNNLLTKKGRTILVSIAGSIGIIGIALVQSVSNGFQAYVDSIEEEALTSYPLTIAQESTDLAGMLLAMRAGTGEGGEIGKLKEEQYISNVLGTLSKNDLKSFKKYIENNKNEINNDISDLEYRYEVEPNIYAMDATNKVAKLSPQSLFNTSFGGSMSIMGSMTSVYAPMMNDRETINKSYDIIAGHLPEKYNEMILVLNDRNIISDLLVYSLGLRNTSELTQIVSKVMNGETAEIHNEPMTFTYEDIFNIKLKLIMPTDKYKYNAQYGIYEDMTQDEDFLREVYNNSEELKIVGILSPKEGVTTTALSLGVNYSSELINHIIEYSKNTDIVKKQLENPDIDVLSGKRFDDPKNNINIDFSDLVQVDANKLKSAFSIDVDESFIQSKMQVLMEKIADGINADISKARDDYKEKFENLAEEYINTIEKDIDENKIDENVEKFAQQKEFQNAIKELETRYGIPKEKLEKAYKGTLKTIMYAYLKGEEGANKIKDIPKEKIQNAISDAETSVKERIKDIDKEKIKEFIDYYTDTASMQEVSEKISKSMVESLVKRYVLSQVGDITGTLTETMADAFNVDPQKIASAFSMNMSEEQLTRIISAMLDKSKKDARANLVMFGYQDTEEPTYIYFYFRSFEGKEHFKKFVEDYNEKVKSNGHDDKEIKYTDTTGILMESVKIIVNAVTYVLIAFISISLVVSSMMIGIITYISVYERTKEIGILRAIGASKKNISSIFNAETFIIGLLSGLFGIGITYALIPIINGVLHHFAGNIPLNATLYPTNAMILVILSIVLTLIGGIIPARAASKKDPVIALRTE